MLHLDTGNTGFMILCTSLVMLMTPGLAFFYGGLVGRKNVLAIMIQSFVSMGWTTVVWYLYGYSLCFSGDWHGIIGNLNMACLRGVNLNTPSPNDTIPALVFFAYQMMFAIITPALISGAFTNRVTFKAYCIFLTLWLTFVYFPFVHMVWGGGILQRWGVLDFAGGIVVHNIAGMAALASVLYVGKRRAADRGPHSIPLVALGTGLLWFGWYGFNAGSEMRVDSVTATAFVNTDVAASFAAVAWLIVAWIRERKPKFLGLLTGAVAGLATVTPAAGYVSPTTAAIIGTIAGVVCYYAVEMKNKLQWDDALDVWGVHGVGGLLGILLLGLFATKAYNPAGADGLFFGNPSFFGKQCVAVVFSSVWAFAFTYGMLKLIDVITPVKVDQVSEEIGLDESLHGENAYTLPDDHEIEKLEHLHALHSNEHELVGK
ncbi:MAG TPA: ammonium transporter [Candidatus Acidoferrales bacterium]|nr:ammonium transporter [Candidatus Acidoferrales bacterium]